MTQTTIKTKSIQSFNTKALGSITFDTQPVAPSTNLKKVGTILVSYGAGSITFSTVTDYLTFVNEVIIPLTNTVHSSSVDAYGASSSLGYVAINPGTAGADAIVD
jgi:hypothetical protein